MRHRIATILLMSVGSLLGADLSIDSGTANANDRMALNVHLTSGSNMLTGLQFDLEYDSTVLDVRVANGPAAENASKGLQAATIGPGQQRVLIVGFNQNSLADGVVAVLQVSLKPKGRLAKSYPIHLIASAGTNARAESVSVTGRGGTVTVPFARNPK